MTAPDWLNKREGGLAAGLDAQTWLVTLQGQPLYRLFATTAQGKLTCVVTQTNNGERLDGGKSYVDVAAALKGGLDELREKLGW